MFWLRIGWIGLVGLCLSFSDQTQTNKESSRNEFQWLVAEEREGVLLDLEQSLSQLAQSLKQQGYYLKVESGVMYAMPSTYFQEAKRAVQLMESLEPFKQQEMAQLPAELTALAQQFFDEYQVRDTRFESVCLSASVTVTYDHQGQTEMIIPVSHEQTRKEIEAFFSASVSPSAPSSGATEKIPEEIEEIFKQFQRDTLSSADTIRSDDTIRSEIPRLSKQPSKAGLLFFHEHRRLSSLEQAQVASRYFQLLAQQITEERQRWQEQAFKIASTFLKPRTDWQGWQGNRWQGRFRDLPPDIQAKLQANAQANHANKFSPDSSILLQINPSIGFLRKEEAGIYSQWFPLSLGNR